MPEKMAILLSRLLVHLLLALLLVPALGGEAAAHAAFVGSNPENGAVVARAPGEIEVTFSEPVSPIVLNLVGADGKPVALSDHHLRGNTLVIKMPGDLAPGSHALSWRVTSLDGHPVGGAITFSVGVPGPAVAVAGEETPPLLKTLIWATRIMVYLGLFFGAGALPFHAFIAAAPGPARRVSAAASLIGLAAALPALGLQGLDMAGAPLPALSDGATWRVAFGSTYAVTLLAAALSMLAGLAAWRLRGTGQKAVVLLAWAGIGVAVAASGHASTADPRWLMRAAVFLHVTMIAGWAGSLPAFLLLVGEGGGAAQAMLRRYSAAILPMVAVLVVAGVTLARVQVGHPSALWQTAYGRVFAAKLVLLAVLFTLAAVNRFRLTPAFAASRPGAAGRFIRSVRWEMALICAILAVVALWRFTPPPRALDAAEAQVQAQTPAGPPAIAHMHGTRAMADLSISPGKVGTAAVTVFLNGSDFRPLAAQEVTLTLANRQAGIGPLRVQLSAGADGGWHTETVPLPAPGMWEAALDVLVTDFESVKLDSVVNILP